VGKMEQMGSLSNGAKATIDVSVPYRISVTIQGSAPIIFHRWNCDAVEAKAKAAKNSASKKTDNVESYVYRDDNGDISLPGEYLRQSILMAAKYKADPRSPRKSAMDLFKAGIVSLTNLSSFGVKDWDFLDRRRVTVQRAGITRVRPALREGWKAEFVLCVLTPEYIAPDLLREVIESAGRLVGVGDFRPTFGRFGIVNFEVLSE
jgi:hypothetical protein